MMRLKLEKIQQTFGANKVLKDVSFSLAQGEVLALLGDNGAGKSTLIKIISGFHQSTSGTIHWEGKPLDRLRYNPKEARQKGIQTVYQHLGLVDQLSLSRNFFLGAELTKNFGPIKILKRLDHSLMNKIVLKELKAMGLTRKLDPNLPVAQLSGGERQALAIGRAKYFGAKLLILDEPTSALSLRQTHEVLDYVRQAAASGISIIYITHTLHHLEELADRTVVLYLGEKVGDFKKGEVTVQDCARLITSGSLHSQNNQINQINTPIQ